MIRTAADLFTASEAELLSFFGDLQVDASQLPSDATGRLLSRMLFILEEQTRQIATLRARSASFTDGMVPAGTLPDFTRGQLLDRVV